jgi:hypothetical protein
MGQEDGGSPRQHARQGVVEQVLAVFVEFSVGFLDDEQ